jgi:hypothetical protein
VGDKTPIATNPFHFKSVFPGVGCDCPYSAVVALNKIIWLDTRSKTIWAFAPGGAPEPVGRNIEKDILKAIDDKERVFGSYDADDNEYTIGIPLAGNRNMTRLWIYNERNKGWTYDEMEGVSRLADTPFTAKGLKISQLPGKIKDLTGKINELSPNQTSSYTRLYGRLDGEVTVEDLLNDRDPALEEDGAIDAGRYETELWSKDFENEDVDTYFSKLVFKIKPYMSGEIHLSYSKNNGLWKVAKSRVFTAFELNRSTLFRFVKLIKARRLNWKLTATSGLFDVEAYEVKVYPSGTYRK